MSDTLLPNYGWGERFCYVSVWWDAVRGVETVIGAANRAMAAKAFEAVSGVVPDKSKIQPAIWRKAEEGYKFYWFRRVCLQIERQKRETTMALESLMSSDSGSGEPK